MYSTCNIDIQECLTLIAWYMFLENRINSYDYEIYVVRSLEQDWFRRTDTKMPSTFIHSIEKKINN